VSRSLVLLLGTIVAVGFGVSGCYSNPQATQDPQTQPCDVEKPAQERERIIAAAKKLQVGQSQAQVEALLGRPDHATSAAKNESQYDYVLRQCKAELLQWSEGKPPEMITVIFRDGRLVRTRSTIQQVPAIGS